MNKVGRIAAREDLRQHLIGNIRQHQCDVTHTLETRGSPYSLVLTKPNGSFERAVKRFETDLQLLSELPRSGATGAELVAAPRKGKVRKVVRKVD